MFSGQPHGGYTYIVIQIFSLAGRLICTFRHTKPGELMKVALIQNVTLNDHRSVHTHNVACELTKRGVEVDLIIQKAHEKLQFAERPYKLIQVPGETYSVTGQLHFMKASCAYIYNGKYQIVHAKNPFSSIFSSILLKKARLITSQIVYDMRGLWVDFGVHKKEVPPAVGTILNVIDTGLMHVCDHVITISPELRDILIARGIPAHKVTAIIGSGCDISEVENTPPEDVKELLGISGPVIGYIGTVSVSRQSDKLIEAFTHVREHCKECYLVLLGPEDGTVTHLIKKTDHVIHREFVPHERALSLLKSFDVAVAYHDRDEPMFNVAVPLKVFEYMAGKIPIVATNHTMYTNILVHKKTGYLTGADPESFAQGVLDVIKDQDLQKSMVDNARVDVENYSIQRLVDQLESVYHQLLERT